MSVRLVFCFVAVASCHASCDEKSGAQPVVEASTPQVPAAEMVPSRRPAMVHPVMRLPVTQQSAAPSPS